MGAWDFDTFDNDMACDWACELEGCDDLECIHSALQEVVDLGDEYLESDQACFALAACEAIARMRGNFGVRNSYTERVDQWAAAHAELNTDSLLPIAEHVIDRITGPESELVDLWKDAGDESFEKWAACVADLRSRLK